MKFTKLTLNDEGKKKLLKIYRNNGLTIWNEIIKSKDMDGKYTFIGPRATTILTRDKIERTRPKISKIDSVMNFWIFRSKKNVLLNYSRLNFDNF